MARIPYLSAEDLPEEQRGLLDRPININRLLATSPGTLAANRFVGRWARFESSVDPRLRELAIVTVGVVTGNEYEYAHHIHIALEFGATDADIDALLLHLSGAGAGSALTGDEVGAIDAARELTEAGTLSAERWASLEASLGRVAALDLVFIVSYYNMVVRVLSALDVDLEPSYEEHLLRHPLPGGASA